MSLQPNNNTLITTTNTNVVGAISTLSIQEKPHQQHQQQQQQEVVIQHLHHDLPFISGKQELSLRHCVTKIFISKFYGEFSIYDESGRLLGTSKDSKLMLYKDNLTTEVSKIWYDVGCLENEYITLKTKYQVKDPGIFFKNGKILFEFDSAPKPATDKTFYHVPVFYNITNVWIHKDQHTLFNTK